MGHKTDQVRGKAKEGVAKVTRDKALAEQGRREQAKGDVKKSGKKLKDAATRS
jgi:uncharacterized protein YjbJ (UPF0337 family)